MRACLFILLLLAATGATAQLQPGDTRTRLETQRKELLQQISATEQELTGLRTEKTVTLNRMKVLQMELEERTKLIENLNEEVAYIDRTMEEYEARIAGLKRKLNRYKLQYTKSIRYAYKSRTSLSMMAYLCSSQDFNEAIRRLRYLQVMRAMRMQQAEKIKATHAEIYHQLDILNVEKANKNKLLADLNLQGRSMQAAKQETDNAVKDLSGREKELQVEIAGKKKAAKRIDDAIEGIIKSEMKTSEEETVGKVKKPANDDADEPAPDEHPKRGKEAAAALPVMPPEELSLAHRFETNRGKLPWPVEKGSVSCHFGKYSLKNIEYFSNGVDIRTVTYGIVKAVYDGTVSSVVEMDGKLMILVRHGNYFSVYGNIIKSMVIKGEKVTGGKPVGLVANNEEGYPTLNFQIWKSAGSGKGTTVLDPEEWLGKTAPH